MVFNKREGIIFTDHDKWRQWNLSKPAIFAKIDHELISILINQCIYPSKFTVNKLMFAAQIV
jgi:hypothetical protein